MPNSIPLTSLEKFTTFGDLLRFLRRRAGITQMDLAISVGYSDAQISRLEQNLRLPDLSTIEARFLPALGIENDAKVAERLLDLAANVRREDAPGLGLCPYKGLNYFDEADADLFAGREALTAKLTQRLLHVSDGASGTPVRFLAVIGASGSGKSSLVRAGLLPSLRWNKRSAEWPIHVLTPTANPLERLAASLTSESNSVAATATLMDDMARDSRSLQIFVKHKLRPGKPGRLLFIIDQFEELFTLCHSEEARNAFIMNLLAAASEENGPVIVVLTLRADFYAHCAKYIRLREALAQSQEYIGAMSEDELRRAIEEPAQRGRWEFEPGLVELLLHEVGNEPGALPLLSHALLETWQRRRNRTMTFGGYASSGGVRGAIAETAETVFMDQFSPRQQTIARRIFLRLTEPGNETSVADTRRRARFDELILNPDEAPATRDVLNKLADARLITTSEDSAEVAHEALIREWHTLRGWLEDNRESLRLHRQLTAAAQEWQIMEKEPSLLFRGARLAHLQEWVQTHAEELNPLELQFLDASVELSQQEVRDREEQHQRELEVATKLADTERQAAIGLRARNRVITGIGIATVILALIAAIFGQQANRNAIFAAQQAQAARNAEETALANAEAADLSRLNAEKLQRIASARELAANADNYLFVDPELSILLALQGVNVTRPDGFVLPEVENALHRAIAASRIEKTLDEPGGALAYSPDGKWMAISNGADFSILDAASFQKIMTIVAHDDVIDNLAFSPDGNRIATASDDGTAKVWDVATGQLILTLAGHRDWVLNIAFRPDGRQIATIGWDNTVRLWSADRGEEQISWPIINVSGPSLFYSSDGSRIYYWADNRVHINDTSTGEEVRSIPSGGKGIVDGDAFSLSPDGTRLVIISPDLTYLSVLATSDYQTRYNIKHPFSEIERIDFSPDGSLFAAVGRDRLIHVWDAATGVELITLAGHHNIIFFLAFSPDGKHIASADRDGVVKIWTLEPGREVLTIPSPVPSHFTLSPDGARIAAIGINNPDTGQPDLLKVWDASDGKLIFTQKAHGFDGRYGGTAVAFSPDGKEIATGGADQTVRIWNADSGEPIMSLPVETGTLWAISYYPDGKTFAVVGNSGLIHLFDRTTGRETQTWNTGLKSLTNISISPDGTQLAVTSNATPDVKIFDAITGEELLTLKGHSNTNWGLAYRADGSRLATSGRDGTARIWDTKTGEMLVVLTGHTSSVDAVRFSPDGERLATGSADGTVRIWDAITGDTLLDIAGSSIGVEFTPDGRRLVMIGNNRSDLKIIAVTLDELVQIAQSRLTRTWTQEECRKYLHLDTCPAAAEGP